MKNKGIKTECPFCSGKLWIDPKSGDVLHQEMPKKDLTGSFDEFLDKNKKQKTILEGKFRAARENEEGKMDRLQKKFDWAKQNPDKLKDKRKKPE